MNSLKNICGTLALLGLAVVLIACFFGSAEEAFLQYSKPLSIFQLTALTGCMIMFLSGSLVLILESKERDVEVFHLQMQDFRHEAQVMAEEKKLCSLKKKAAQFMCVAKTYGYASFTGKDIENTFVPNMEDGYEKSASGRDLRIMHDNRKE